MTDVGSSPGRLEVFRTLREGLSLLPRAIGPFLLAYLVALGLMVILVAVIVYPHLRAQVPGAIPAESPETEGVPA